MIRELLRRFIQRPQQQPCPSHDAPSRLVSVCKASPVGDQVIDSVTIDISADIEELAGPTGDITRPSPLGIYKLDAQQIRSALRALPMGTRDQLLIMMLEDAATMLRIPGDDLEGNGE